MSSHSHKHYRIYGNSSSRQCYETNSSSKHVYMRQNGIEYDHSNPKADNYSPHDSGCSSLSTQEWLNGSHRMQTYSKDSEVIRSDDFLLPPQAWKLKPSDIKDYLMHSTECEILYCPCKLIQERYEHLRASRRIAPEFKTSVYAFDLRKANMHLNLDVEKQLHSHYHMTTRSHVFSSSDPNIASKKANILTGSDDKLMTVRSHVFSRSDSDIASRKVNMHLNRDEKLHPHYYTRHYRSLSDLTPLPQLGRATEVDGISTIYVGPTKKELLNQTTVTPRPLSRPNPSLISLSLTSQPKHATYQSSHASSGHGSLTMYDKSYQQSPIPRGRPFKTVTVVNSDGSVTRTTEC